MSNALTISDLQSRLKATGRYIGEIDDVYGRGTRSAVLLALTDGPDTVLSEADFAASAARLQVPVAAIRAVTDVESSGAGFAGGRPVLLFEPHRFSRATKGVYDARFPNISYPKWDRSKYPKTQEGRYAQLLDAVALNPDAAFASASYGRFQVLGENFAACGFASSFDFAIAHAYDEASQLMAFEKFIIARGLLKHLRALNWAAFAAGYNGSAFRVNQYDTKLAAAYRARGGK